MEQLQKRNAELEAEVRSLKNQTAAVPEGKTKTKVTYDGKTYVEKAVVQEKLPVYAQQRGAELKLVLGGFIQVNFEDSDAFAFNGNFGQSAIKDRFRLRRARVNLTGDFAEQFDFKVEGDFGQNDGTNNNRTAFSGTDIWLNWHQFPGAQIKIGQYQSAIRIGPAYSRYVSVHYRTHFADRRNYTGSADRCSALGNAFYEHLA